HRYPADHDADGPDRDAADSECGHGCDPDPAGRLCRRPAASLTAASGRQFALTTVFLHVTVWCHVVDHRENPDDCATAGCAVDLARRQSVWTVRRQPAVSKSLLAHPRFPRIAVAGTSQRAEFPQRASAWIVWQPLLVCLVWWQWHR